MNEILGWLVGAIVGGVVGFLFCHFIITLYEGMRATDTKPTETEEFLRKDAYWKVVLIGTAIFAIVSLVWHIKP